jgi:hypothetical protein
MIKRKKELKDSYTLYWIDYLFEIGSQELQQTHFDDMNVFSYFDLDIHFFLFTLLFGFFFGTYKLLSYCLIRKKPQISQDIRSK